ncbi:MAG: acylphosphatase [Candidatus Firestonebacteria bacterium]|nr:acylphosphatase [Candidatus Firestonebacteria bacterium]
MKRIHICFSGIVQGVGFRFTCRDIAERLGNITGTVENLSDHRVELIAEGEEKILSEFLKKIEEYFSANIKYTEVEWEQSTGEYDSFEIK